MSNPFEPALCIEEIIPLFPKITNIQEHKIGGEGIVFKGFHTLANKDVALKIYSLDRLTRRTELETRKLEQASCKYLVSLIEYGNIILRKVKSLYVTTEFIQGKTLNDLLKEGYRLNSDEAVHLIKCIGKAIDTLWGLNVVHCDITPKNIIKKDNGDYVLIDLGIAKHLDEATMTQFGQIFGTYGYIAPEQIHGRKNLTLRADFYSLGIVTYQAITGSHPFGFRQDIMFSQQIPKLPNDININKQLENLIYKMTEKHAYRRPTSYQEILELLDGGVKDVSI